MAKIQSTQSIRTGVTSADVAYPSNVGTGHFLWVAHVQFQSGGNTIATPTATSHTFTSDGAAQAIGTQTRQQSFYELNAPSGACTVHFAPSGGTADLSLVIAEFDQVNTSGALDQFASGSGNSTSPSSGATGTRAQGDELLLGCVCHDGTNRTITENASDTLLEEHEGGSSDMPIGTSYRIVTAAGTDAATWTFGTGSVNWLARRSTFRMTVSSGGAAMNANAATATAQAETATFRGAASLSANAATATATAQTATFNAAARFSANAATATAQAETATLRGAAVLTANTATATAQAETASLRGAAILAANAATATAQAEIATFKGGAILGANAASATAAAQTATFSTTGGAVFQANTATATAQAETASFRAAAVFAANASTATTQAQVSQLLGGGALTALAATSSAAAQVLTVRTGAVLAMAVAGASATAYAPIMQSLGAIPRVILQTGVLPISSIGGSLRPISQTTKIVPVSQTNRVRIV